LKVDGHDYKINFTATQARHWYKNTIVSAFNFCDVCNIKKLTMKQVFKQTIILCMAAVFLFACTKENNTANNQTNKMEANKKAVAKQWEALNNHDMEAFAQFFSDSSRNHGIPVGREGIKAVVTDILKTFPDVNFKVIDIFADGDWVIIRGIFSGTHKGVATIPHHGGLLMPPQQPTNKSFGVQHIHQYKLENGLITEHFASRDDVEMYQQLGILPATPSFEPPTESQQ
jgi:predicted ester cyclase